MLISSCSYNVLVVSLHVRDVKYGIILGSTYKLKSVTVNRETLSG